MGHGHPCWGQGFNTQPALGSMACRLMEQTTAFNAPALHLEVHSAFACSAGVKSCGAVSQTRVSFPSQLLMLLS